MILQHLYWTDIRSAVRKEITECDVCQRTKQSNKYGQLPATLAEEITWDKIFVNIIGPNKILIKVRYPLIIKDVTTIDPVTGWFEITQYNNKKAMAIVKLVETMWLVRYPCPVEIMYDQRGKFLGGEFKSSLIEQEYDIKTKPDLPRNPQEGATIERIYQVLGNILRTYNLQEAYVDDSDPWMGILAAADFVVKSTYHRTKQKSPGQFVFGRYMILPINHIEN